MKLRIGLAGYGRRGRGHIRALEMIDEGIVAAISDPIEASRRAAEAELDGISTYATVEEMIDNGDIQAVIVTAPAHLNGKVAMPAIERGLPVLVEKPPAMSSPELASMIERSELHGTKVMVAFNRRFNPLIQAAIDVIREAGPLHQMVAEFHKDIHDFTDDPRFSPAIFDLMLLESPIHSVDLFTHIADAPVANVVAIVKRTASPYRDVHAALIEFENDVVCQFTSAYTAGGRLERYELHGEYVSVYLEGVNRGWILRGNERSELKVSDDSEIDTVAQARVFVNCVIKGIDYPAPAATLDTSVATLSLSEAILGATEAAR